MEFITTLDEAVEYVSEFIFDDLPLLADLDYNTILSSGFEESEDGSYTHPSGYKLDSISQHKLQMIKGDCNIVIDGRNGYAYYDISYNEYGMSCFVKMKINGDYTRDYISIIIIQERKEVDSCRSNTKVMIPFVDKDDTFLHKEMVFSGGILELTRFTAINWRPHCRYGPALIRRGKEYYYINGVKMSKKRWLKHV